MQIEVQLFGAFRQFQPEPRLTLELSEGATVADVRQALAAHAAAHWPRCPAGLLDATALASAEAVLDEFAPAPARLAVLPPVSGG
jgi:molybdopterin synthase sulfur carrier subunit